MNDQNAFLLSIQREKKYGTMEQSNGNQKEHVILEQDDPNSCWNLICEKWNIILLVSTFFTFVFIIFLIVAFK